MRSKEGILDGKRKKVCVLVEKWVLGIVNSLLLLACICRMAAYLNTMEVFALTFAIAACILSWVSLGLENKRCGFLWACEVLTAYSWVVFGIVAMVIHDEQSLQSRNVQYLLLKSPFEDAKEATNVHVSLQTFRVNAHSSKKVREFAQAAVLRETENRLFPAVPLLQRVSWDRDKNELSIYTGQVRASTKFKEDNVESEKLIHALIKTVRKLHRAGIVLGKICAQDISIVDTDGSSPGAYDVVFNNLRFAVKASDLSKNRLLTTFLYPKPYPEMPQKLSWSQTASVIFLNAVTHLGLSTLLFGDGIHYEYRSKEADIWMLGRTIEEAFLKKGLPEDLFYQIQYMVENLKNPNPRERLAYFATMQP